MGSLRVVTVDAAAALAGDWRRRAAAADVVRVAGVTPALWDGLHAAGFAVKPSWVTWGAPLRAGEEEFVAALAAKEQRNIRDSRRAAAGTRIEVEPLTAAALAEFLPVYDALISGMPNGVGWARRRRWQLLADAASHVLVAARVGGELVGGCVCRVHGDLAMIRVSFAATVPQARAAMLTRAMYLVAAQHGRDLGLRWMSLGSDPALWGETTRPGLFTFKARLGFVPIPIRCFDPTDSDAPDIAEAVLSLRALSDPALSLCYATPDGPARDWHWADPPPWQLRVLSADPAVDTRPYRAPFLRATTVEVLPAAAHRLAA